ncbi:hypothetical protein QKW60_03240 [Defluviimonas aestuarii]|jgi:hypothetical protein|nr:hypothetical protein [Defluviimonas aestuarii]MDI3335410.1 hypothetical protein [Defluviimonas aestuarii]
MSYKVLLACALVAFAAACAQQEEVVVEQPVSEEPVFTGKYGS